MAVLKLSQIASAPAPPALTDTVIGVGPGPTDFQYTLAQLASTIGLAIGAAVTGGTSGSVLFIDGSGHLAQDNAKFFWDDSGFILKIQSELDFQGTTSTVKVNGANKLDYGVTNAGAWSSAVDFGLASTSNKVFIGPSKAIYVVPNVNGDNWFEGDAGNQTMTGWENFGTGAGTLGSLTTGLRNCSLGTGNLAFLQSGSSNFAMGTNCLRGITAGSSNIAMGVGNLQSGSNINGCIVIGVASAQVLATSGSAESSVVVIGNNCLSSLVSNASGTIAIGSGIAGNYTDGGAAGTGRGNILIGASVASNVTGTSQTNTIIGQDTLASATALNNCTILGPWKGAAASYSDIVVITDGLTGLFNPVNEPLLDWNYTQANVFSLKRKTTAQGFQIYNTHDDANPTVNYERGCLDWTLTSNIFRLASQAGGTGTARLIAIDGFQKSGAPAAGDLPSGSWTLINDTSGGQTWLVYNNAGTIRKVQLV